MRIQALTFDRISSFIRVDHSITH